MTVPSLITAEMLQPVIDAVKSNVGLVFPVGIAIFAVLLGVSIIPKLIKVFTGIHW